MNSIKLAILVALLLAHLPSHAESDIDQSTDDLFDLSLEELLAIPVHVASNLEFDARKQPVSVTVIDQSTLISSGARTLSEAISILVPGYFLVEDQDDTIAGFRGLVPDNNSKVLLLMNGQKVNTEWFWGPPDALLNSQDFNFIERIEVIKGPGSVTLGQGALLGVINIVTIGNQVESGAEVHVSMGSEVRQHQSVSVSYKGSEASVYLYMSQGSYEGNLLENKGWAEKRIEQGLSVYDRRHRLHRNGFQNIFSRLKSDDWNIDLFRFEQERDLYNFFRDREVLHQTLKGITGNYVIQPTKNWEISLNGHFSEDDYGLSSHGNNINKSSRLQFEQIDSGFATLLDDLPNFADGSVAPGLIMGGVREQRYGSKFLVRHFNEDQSHQIAFGIEWGFFQLGLKDRNDNNFIINEESQKLGIKPGNTSLIAEGTVNENNPWVKPYDFGVASVFIEDSLKLTESLQLISALRLDQHPDWGKKATPRLSAIYNFSKDQILRATWQTGFRGAVGVHYSGGFVQDGFLAESNFSAVNSISTSEADFDFNGVAADDDKILKKAKPETIQNFELAWNWAPNKKEFYGITSFLNQVSEILTAEAHGYESLRYGDVVGDDEIGTWGGNWYYQNQSGELSQFGIEAETVQQFNRLKLNLSHSMVTILEADESTLGVYAVSKNGSPKQAAFPENISRVRFEWAASNHWKVYYNHLYYWGFWSPTSAYVKGSHLGNVSIRYDSKNIKNLMTVFTIKNIFSQKGLYPINGTGNLQGANGTPSIESVGGWLDIRYRF